MLVIAFDDHDKKENMDESKNPGWKLDSCPGGEWQRMAKGSRPHLERNAVSSWLELWQVPGIEELAWNLDLKRINAGLSMPTHWSQSLTLCATMLSGPIYPPPSSMLEVFWETSSSATLLTGSELLKLEEKSWNAGLVGERPSSSSCSWQPASVLPSLLPQTTPSSPSSG